MIIANLLFFMSLVFFPAFSWAQSSELLAKAEKEGEVNLYATMSVADFLHFGKAFKEKYPTINLRHISLPSSRQTARVMQEFRAGRVQADVLGNSPDTLIYLKQQGVLGPYRSAETKYLIPGAWATTVTGPARPPIFWSPATIHACCHARRCRRVTTTTCGRS